MAKPFSHALVRQPSMKIAQGELTHLERTRLDVARAFDQHAAYVALLRRHGLRIVEAPAAPDYPDGLFVEDVLLVIGTQAILTRPGAPSRRGELAGMADLVKQLDLSIHTIEAPGTIDGGDVLVTDRHVFVGRSSRSNSEGFAQVAELSPVLARAVVAVDVERVLHLKSAVTSLPDGSLIAAPDLIDTQVLRALGYQVRHALEPSAGDALCLGDVVVLPADAPASADMLRKLGFVVEALDVSELQKIEAGVTCMSVLFSL